MMELYDTREKRFTITNKAQLYLSSVKYLISFHAVFNHDTLNGPSLGARTAADSYCVYVHTVNITGIVDAFVFFD